MDKSGYPRTFGERKDEKTWGVAGLPKKSAYPSFMRKLSLVFIASALLMTGCSSNTTQPKYDEVDLIKYEACIDSVLSIYERGGQAYGEVVMAGAEDACKRYLPVKK